MIAVMPATCRRRAKVLPIAMKGATNARCLAVLPNQHCSAGSLLSYSRDSNPLVRFDARGLLAQGANDGVCRDRPASRLVGRKRSDCSIRLSHPVLGRDAAGLLDDPNSLADPVGAVDNDR